MSVAADEAGDEEKTVGKAGLAARLGWTRERLDRYLHQHPEFPVVQRASKGIAWQFDVEAALAYVANVDAKPKEAGELTPRARREIAQAEAIERKNRLEAGELVELGPLRDDLTTMFSELGKSFDDLGGEIVKRLGLPEESHRVIQELIDERRRMMIAAMEDYLPDDDRTE